MWGEINKVGRSVFKTSGTHAKNAHSIVGYVHRHGIKITVDRDGPIQLKLVVGCVELEGAGTVGRAIQCP